VDDSHFGLQLRSIREERNLKQWELASDMGIAPRHISNYETGRVEPTVPTIRKLAEALGVTPGRLLEEGANG
jgi:transcriptional regulator with XRE-family HTH domain